MRSLLLLLFAATVSAPLGAQWVSPVEQSYGPYSRPQRGGRHAAAVGSGGILLAWSETIGGATRIRAGLLDSRAQLISEIATLPAAAENAEAYAPAVSFNGESFLVAWIERYRGGEKMYSLAVDRNGTPGTQVKSHGFVQTEDATPLIVWDGAAWQVLEGTHAATVKNGVLATATWKTTFIFDSCGRIAICPVKATRWDIAWTAGNANGSERVGDEWPTGTSIGALDIAAAGNDFAVAWATSLGIGYLFTSSARSTTIHGFVDDDVAPGIACDDERCLIAYGTGNGDVQAIVVETDDLRSPQLLAISATERKEHSPRVHSLGSGRFLVSYLSDQGTADQRINGRIVGFTAPAKRRAMR